LKAQTHAQCQKCFAAYQDNLAGRQKGVGGLFVVKDAPPG